VCMCVRVYRQALAVSAPMTAAELAALSLPERYTVSLCHRLATDVTKQLEEYVLGQAGDQVYNTLKYIICNVIIFKK
jgi:valyl-tRNA synthetase